MSAPVDVLAVMRNAVFVLDERHPTNNSPSAEDLRKAIDAFNDLLAFAENIATAYSEPLNSLCVCKRLEDRRHWMGDLRRSARAALARCGVPQP